MSNDTVPMSRELLPWAAQWIKDNYQAHDNIASLCDAMLAAAPQPQPAEPASGVVWSLLRESKANFERQFGPSPVADWVYKDFADLYVRAEREAQEQTAEPVNQQLLDALHHVRMVLPNDRWADDTKRMIDAAIAAAEQPLSAAKAAQPALESVPRDEPVAWSPRDLELIDGMIKVQLQQCRNAALLEAAELCERDVWPDDECGSARVDTGEILGRMLRAKVKEQK